MKITVRGIPQEIADEVRRTHLSPGYDHPAHREVARGTGPCRCCLRPFVPGRDERLLFTYRPSGEASLMAPGPIFIHAEHCVAYAGDDFPDSLRPLPLAFEARGVASRVLALSTSSESGAEAQIEQLFSSPDARWLHVRHAEAGCFIARVERAA